MSTKPIYKLAKSLLSRIRESEKDIKEFHSMKNLVWKNVCDTSFSGNIKKIGTRDSESTALISTRKQYSFQVHLPQISPSQELQSFQELKEQRRRATS